METVETKHFKVTPSVRERWDAVIRAAVKEANAGAIEAALDKRYTSRPYVKDAKGKIVKYGWSAYERYLTSSGRTVFFSIPTEHASVSEKIDKFAQGKIERREKRAAKAAERAAKKETVTKAISKTKTASKESHKLAKTVKAARKVHASYDPAAEVLNAMAGVSASSQKHNAKKEKAAKPVDAEQTVTSTPQEVA
jgi:hypothetical protein